MTEEDKNIVKEIAAKIVHEKLKEICDKIEGQVISRVLKLIKDGCFSNASVNAPEINEIFLKRLENQCLVKIQAIFRASYLKFMDCFKVENN